MDRRHLIARARIAAAALLVSMSVVANPAGALSYASLHVRSFTLSTDNLQPHVGETFHLTLAVHVDEQIAQLDNVTLPDLSGFDVSGDERRCAANSKGTDCTETISLAPTVAGRRTIGSITMDAIDASDKSPTRFATNSLRIDVRDAPPGSQPQQPQDQQAGDSTVGELFWDTVRSFGLLLLLVTALWYVLWRYARPRALPAVAPVAVPTPVAVPVAPYGDDFSTRYRSLVDTLASTPSRANAAAVRDALRYALGAREKETLADLVARNAAADYPQRISALRAIERPVFCEDAYVTENVREALPFLTI